MIARTAQIRAVVSDPVATVQALTALVEVKGGFISDSRQWRSGEQMLASLTIRVPVRDLSATLDSIRHRAIRVEHESTSGEDVTERYADLRAQLTNLRATETELRALLVTVRQRTQKAADILEVFNQLTSIRQQIDRTQSRITTLEQLTDLATITVELVPDALAQPLTAGRWRPLTVVRAAFRTLLSTLRGLLEAVIWLLIYFVPVVLVLAVPAFGVFIGIRAVRKRMRPRKGAVPDAG
jgi:glycine cleavage system regulatory protein